MPPIPHLPTDRSATIGVIGDDLGNDTDEWVNTLGELLGSSRQTRVQRIDQEEHTAYLKPIRYGDADPAASVFNASADGLDPEVGAGQVKVLLPERPDVVLLSTGHQADAGKIPGQLSRTRQAVLTVYPQSRVVAVLQPAVGRPGESAPARKAVSTWAAGAGVPTIDVAAAFAEGSGKDALTSADALTRAGSRLWAGVVHQALTGQASPAAAPAPAAPASPTRSGTDRPTPTPEVEPSDDPSPTATRTRRQRPSEPSPTPTRRPRRGTQPSPEPTATSPGATPEPTATDG